MRSPRWVLRQVMRRATRSPSASASSMVSRKSGKVARIAAAANSATIREWPTVWLAASKASCEARIPEVKAPVLVVMGTKDPDFPDPAAEAKLTAERLRGRVELVEGAGHYPHAELPEQVGPAIVAFLRCAQREGQPVA